MAKKNQKKTKETKLDTLEQIKRLLVLGLSRQGISGKDIAATIDVGEATISRMLPNSQAKKK